MSPIHNLCWENRQGWSLSSVADLKSPNKLENTLRIWQLAEHVQIQSPRIGDWFMTGPWQATAYMIGMNGYIWLAADWWHQFWVDGTVSALYSDDCVCIMYPDSVLLVAKHDRYRMSYRRLHIQWRIGHLEIGQMPGGLTLALLGHTEWDITALIKDDNNY